MSCKKLRDEGFHIFLGMVGYCIEGNGAKHFEFVHRIVSARMDVLYAVQYGRL